MLNALPSLSLAASAELMYGSMRLRSATALARLQPAADLQLTVTVSNRLGEPPEATDTDSVRSRASVCCSSSDALALRARGVNGGVVTVGGCVMQAAACPIA